jgi:hypothetical protein
MKLLRRALTRGIAFGLAAARRVDRAPQDGAFVLSGSPARTRLSDPALATG